MASGTIAFIRIARRRCKLSLLTVPHSVSDLYNKVIGKGNGVYISDEFYWAQESGKIVVEEINDADGGNIKKLESGRIDTAIGVVETMEYFAGEMGYTDLVVLDTMLQQSHPAYLVISKKSDVSKDHEITQRISKAVSEIMANGKYESIKAKYLVR